MSRRLLEAASGSRTEAFGAQEWLLLSGIALIWGSSFLFIDIGLQTLRPGVVALARLALGVATLALPDSPRWYAVKGRLDDTRRVLDLSRDRAEADEEYNIVAQHAKRDHQDDRNRY